MFQGGYTPEISHRYQKWPYFTRMSPFARPIIWVSMLVFGGVALSTFILHLGGGVNDFLCLHQIGSDPI